MDLEIKPATARSANLISCASASEHASISNLITSGGASRSHPLELAGVSERGSVYPGNWEP